MLRGKRCIVSGAAGSIGSELVRQLAPKHKVYCLDTNETGIYDLICSEQEKGNWVYGRVGDIRDYDTLKDVFDDFKPQVVYHAAAYKHVTPMELTPIEAIKTNVLGTYNLIHLSRIYEVKKFVFISTDKAVQSSSVMGATKRLGEIMVRNQGRGFIVVRFGNVLGSRGSVIPIWERQMNQGKNLTVTDASMERYFMTIEEACDLVIQAAEIGKGGEIIILDMGRPVKVLDLARKIIKDSGKDISVNLIGKRPGEFLSEKLMFEEEEKVAVKHGKFFIIK